MEVGSEIKGEWGAPVMLQTPNLNGLIQQRFSSHSFCRSITDC